MLAKYPSSPIRNNAFALLLERRRSPDYIPTKKHITLPIIKQQITCLNRLPVVITPRKQASSLKPIMSKMYSSIAAAKQQIPFDKMLPAVIDSFSELKRSQFAFNLDIFDGIHFQEEKRKRGQILKETQSHNELYAQKKMLVIILGQIFAEEFFQYVQKMKWQNSKNGNQEIKVNEENYVQTVLEIINMIIAKAKGCR